MKAHLRAPPTCTSSLIFIHFATLNQESPAFSLLRASYSECASFTELGVRVDYKFFIIIITTTGCLLRSSQVLRARNAQFSLLINMFPSSNAAWLLLAQLICWSSAQTFPSIAEVDLLFPRNDTYAPTALMPTVFAIQNPAVSVPLDLALEWHLYQLTDGNVTAVGTGFITKSYLTASTPGAYYEYSSLYNLTTMEGTWSLFWTISSVNCTQFPTSDTSIPGYTQGKAVYFTTKNGSQATDLVAATASDVCASAESFSFNVTGEETVSAGSGNSVTTCAVVAPMAPTYTPNPCAAQLNATDASSISAALTGSACSLPSPLVSCPTKSAGSVEAQLRGPIWVVAIFGWLIYAIMG